MLVPTMIQVAIVSLNSGLARTIMCFPLGVTERSYPIVYQHRGVACLACAATILLASPHKRCRRLALAVALCLLVYAHPRIESPEREMDLRLSTVALLLAAHLTLAGCETETGATPESDAQALSDGGACTGRRCGRSTRVVGCSDRKLRTRGD